MISILIADDHPLIREALRHVLEEQVDFKIVGEAGNGSEAIELATKLEPDVVIMDIGMPKLNGVEATRQIKAKCPTTEILVLTIHEEKDHIFDILECGAAGYLTKKIFGQEMIHAIRGVVAGEAVLDKAVAKELVNRALRSTVKPVVLDTGEKLTTREIDIIRYLAKGMSNKEIAAKMDISVPTVKTYMANIFSKLGTNSRWQTVISGLRNGLISSDDLTDSQYP
ncbi:response regulator [Chloroflexota bacterium]